MANNFLVNGANLDNLLVPKNAIWQPGDRNTLWAWGRNSYSNLGLSNFTHRSSPVQVGSLTNWLLVAGLSNHTVAIKTDGTLWSWGGNGYGQLGLGDRTNRSSPVQVGSLNTWSKITNEIFCNFAIKTDGTLWSWGGNNDGRLGLGDTTHRSSPVQVGSLNTWFAVSVSNSRTVLAIKTDGTLWSWGYNGVEGALGLGAGDRTHRSSPVQVGSLNTWSKIACGTSSLAIKTDGTLWAWGSNYLGNLGLGDRTHRSSPVQVGSLNTWSNISNSALNCCAIKTDGTLWSWGHNGYGTLGLGDITGTSSPVQVGSLNTWASVSATETSVFATKTDGTLWSWGSNGYSGGYGQLGLGDRTHRSSPVQVGSLTNWLVFGGRENCFAIQSL